MLKETFTAICIILNSIAVCNEVHIVHLHFFYTVMDPNRKEHLTGTWTQSRTVQQGTAEEYWLEPLRFWKKLEEYLGFLGFLTTLL